MSCTFSSMFDSASESSPVRFLSAADAKTRINALAREGIPFICSVDFELTSGFVLENPLEQQIVLFQTPLGGNCVSAVLSESNGDGLQLDTAPISYPLYRERFDQIQAALERGDTYLANLTVKTPIRTDVSLRDIFHRSISPYRILVPERFVCFSPECFVRISDNMISTCPMKGTLDAALPNAEERLLKDPKETAEHCTVVDLLRNDLSMVASDVRVERFRYIDRIVSRQRKLLQVSSEVRGRLSTDWRERLGDILFRMLPAGSVSGAPKRSTLELLHRIEGEPRGFYTGVFGYFDGSVFDSAVLIRFIEETDEQLFFRSGGGITLDSSPEREYAETLEKIYLPFR